VSAIENIARALQGVCRPITGDSATGTVTLTATGADVKWRHGRNILLEYRW
jgi:hypothetical protein